MARTPIFPIRLDDETKARWDAAARDAGYSLAEYIRVAVDDLIERETKPVAKSKKKAVTKTTVRVGLDPELRASKGPRTGLCPHRIPPTAFCSRCGS